MRKSENKKLRNNKANKRKKLVIIGSIILLFIAGGVIYNLNNNNNETVQAHDVQSNDATNNLEDSKEELKSEENSLDNSGYLALEDDPNADDVMEVSRVTQGLLKGELQYPVRKDGKKVVYLTFDDGPSTTNTPQVLDILKKYDIKATFFITGKSLEVNGSKDILKREVTEGHAIANHSYTHDYSYLYPNRVINVDRFMGEVDKTNNKLKEVLGKDFSTRTVRLPGGYWSWNGRTNAKKAFDENGLAIIEWNALNGDAEAVGRKEAQLIKQTEETVDSLGPNADSVVFLMHDTYNKEETVKALPEIIEFFKSKGYEFRTMK